MSRRSRILLVVMVLFNLVNVAGTAYAAMMGEPMHAAVHSVLLLAGLYGTWRALPQRVHDY